MVNIFGEFCMEMFPMKWTLKLEHIDEPGILRSTVEGLIERPEPTCEADLGLTPVTMASTSSGRRSPKSPTTKFER